MDWDLERPVVLHVAPGKGGNNRCELCTEHGRGVRADRPGAFREGLRGATLLGQQGTNLTLSVTLLPEHADQAPAARRLREVLGAAVTIDSPGRSAPESGRDGPGA